MKMIQWIKKVIRLANPTHSMTKALMEELETNRQEFGRIIKPATGHPGNGYVVVSVHKAGDYRKVCISASLVDAAKGKICPGDSIDLNINEVEMRAKIVHNDNGNKAARTSKDPRASKNLRIIWMDQIGLAEVIPAKTKLPITDFLKGGGIEFEWPFARPAKKQMSICEEEATL